MKILHKFFAIFVKNVFPYIISVTLFIERKHINYNYSSMVICINEVVLHVAALFEQDQYTYTVYTFFWLKVNAHSCTNQQLNKKNNLLILIP